MVQETLDRFGRKYHEHKVLPNQSLTWYPISSSLNDLENLVFSNRHT